MISSGAFLGVASKAHFFRNSCGYSHEMPGRQWCSGWCLTQHQVKGESVSCRRIQGVIMQRISILMCGIVLFGFSGCLSDTEASINADILETLFPDTENEGPKDALSQEDATTTGDSSQGPDDAAPSHDADAVADITASTTGDAAADTDTKTAPTDAEAPIPDVDGPVICPEGCDDDNPCTVDSCIEGECVHADDGSCEIKSCSGQNLSDPIQFYALPEGAAAKMALEVDTDTGSSCTEAACQEDNPCCNTCDAQLYLMVPEQLGNEIPYDATQTNMAWNCQTDDCGGSQSCQPVNVGHVYWIWGHITYTPFQSTESDEDADPAEDSAALPAAPQPFLLIEDWCIPTIPSELVGDYHGFYEDPTDGARQMTLTIEHDEAGDSWSVSLDSESQCDGETYALCSTHIPVQAATAVVIGDGSLSFDVRACAVDTTNPDLFPSSNNDCALGTQLMLRFELASARENLEGSVVVSLTDDAAGELIGVSDEPGTVSFEREVLPNE
jgi:hypothetical protein